MRTYTRHRHDRFHLIGIGLLCFAIMPVLVPLLDCYLPGAAHWDALSWQVYVIGGVIYAASLPPTLLLRRAPRLQRALLSVVSAAGWLAPLGFVVWLAVHQ